MVQVVSADLGTRDRLKTRCCSTSETDQETKEGEAQSRAGRSVLVAWRHCHSEESHIGKGKPRIQSGGCSNNSDNVTMYQDSSVYSVLGCSVQRLYLELHHL